MEIREELQLNPVADEVSAITAVVCYLVLGNSDRVARALGETGIRILVRIMGLLLVALAVQYFVNGFVDLGVLNRPSVA